MKRALSTHVVTQQRLTLAWLQKLQLSGIPAVEIFCARQHFDYRDKAQVRELGHWFRDAELTLHSLHSPMYSDEYGGRSGPDAVITITEPNKGNRIRMVDEIKRAIEVAEAAPFAYLIQHMGVLNEEYSDRKVESAFTALEELSLFARQRGVNILLENIPNQLSTGEGLQHFLRMTHLDLNFVFDTGHAHIGAGIGPEFEIMKERIRSLHVHDNNGKDDQHLFPMLASGGTVDWAATMELLKSRPNQYPLLLELKESPDFHNPIESANEIFDRLERA